MTFEEVLRQYCLKIGQAWGNMGEDLTTESLERVASAYWSICADTGCTFKPLTSVSLSAVTATTNKHELYTALSLTTGQEIFAVVDVTWEGVHLARWDKNGIDAANEYGDETGSSDPRAYAVWEEWVEADNEKHTYIAFFPFVGTANTTDCKISYFLRPVKPTTSNYTSTYPLFAGEYHELIAEKAALKYLRDQGSQRYNAARMAEFAMELAKMKQHYMDQVMAFEIIDAPTNQRMSWLDVKFYGE